MSLETFLARLDPKTAARVKTAQEIEVERLELASHGLTECLGGGIAKGRIAMIYGNQSSGKTLLMQQSIGKWQEQGLVCAWVDVEGAWDKEWAARLGVDNEQLILIQSKSSGRIEKEIAPLLRARIDVLVIDSISDIMPEVFVDEKTGELNDQEKRKQMGAQAKAITALLNGILYLNEDTAVVILSQTTTEIGQTYVKQVPHGGKKALFASSQIVKLTSNNSEAKQIKGENWVGNKVFETLIGRKVEAIVEKNKLGKQWTTCAYDMYYAGSDVGIDRIGEIVDEAIDFDVVKKGGAWFNYGDQKFQGRPSVVQFFKSEPDELEAAVQAIRKVKNV